MGLCLLGIGLGLGNAGGGILLGLLDSYLGGRDLVPGDAFGHGCSRHCRFAHSRLIAIPGRCRFGRPTVVVRDRGLDTYGGTDGCRADCSTLGNRDALALLASLELHAQVVIVGAQTTQLNDNLVEKVVDLLFVVATTKLSRGEMLVKDILGRERHVVTSVETGQGPHHLIANPGG